jgi:hypothetical protein
VKARDLFYVLREKGQIACDFIDAELGDEVIIHHPDKDVKMTLSAVCVSKKDKIISLRVTGWVLG